jgi:hypothetical protein
MDLVTETLDYDGGRKVTVCVPPHPPQAVVFPGDGQLIAPWVMMWRRPARRLGVWSMSGHPVCLTRKVMSPARGRSLL